MMIIQSKNDTVYLYAMSQACALQNPSKTLIASPCTTVLPFSCESFMYKGSLSHGLISISKSSIVPWASTIVPSALQKNRNQEFSDQNL